MILTLPPGCRQVLILRNLDGLSYQEIADSLGVSLSDVGKHFNVLGKSEPTVKQQVRSIVAKTGPPNRGRLIACLCTGATSPEL